MVGFVFVYPLNMLQTQRIIHQTGHCHQNKWSMPFSFEIPIKQCIIKTMTSGLLVQTYHLINLEIWWVTQYLVGYVFFTLYICYKDKEPFIKLVICTKTNDSCLFSFVSQINEFLIHEMTPSSQVSRLRVTSC